MTIEQYYRWINTKAGKKIKDFMNRLIPGTDARTSTGQSAG